ncbi:sodium:proton antiporter [Rheinheimera mesophila]|uniref:Sodium:proton antiporter n=1 Tax=Rheinheimera mesophila TaxID=1547515 RepID=A0A3P3QLB9_9GAMM|nr:Na+/H+ antiporter NhaC family protein [Rheinheimera mesophila]KKL01619.1 sodium:proton antiporter [Rheinheimera mesophila]RRJ21153.1 sodium:proton antiporter [Rheinheimera mesophila]
MDSPSAISLIPPVVVMAVAIWLKRPILSLVVGAVAGLLMLFPTQPFELLNTFAEISTSVMQDETIGWLILVCGGFGSLIGLLIHTGGAVAFGRSASKLATGPRSSMFMTFVLGCIIFIDDYLNALSVGEAMKRVTDKYKISRQMLAYIVDSTAAPICVIIPISTWAIFFGGLLENNKVAEAGQGVDVYIQAIPYMLYPWLAVLMVMLVTLKIMPAIGPMKKAELAAQNGTPMDMLPDVGVEASASHHHVQGQTVPAGDQYAVHSMEQEFEESNKHGKLRNFVVPMLMLIGFTIYFDIDVLKGLIVTLVLTLAFYAYQRLMPLGEMMEVMMNGFKTMLPAICTVIAAFVFKDVCDKLLLPQYVIENLTPYMTAQMLPAIVFLAMAILSFATGSSWGIFAVSIPIVMPLAYAVEADIPLVIGALLSASSFGSQACFYSDSTVLAAQGSGCNLVSHAVTQLPYCLIAASLAFVGFILIA